MTSRQAYLDSHPSLNASMEDYEAREFSPTFPTVPSHHSGFQSPNTSEYSERSRRSYSPPAWRKAGSGWFKHPPLSPHRSGFASNEPSPQYHDVDDEGDLRLTAYRSAARIPLPRSPTGGLSTRNTPEVATAAGAQEDEGGGGDTTITNMIQDVEPESPSVLPANESNYIRFTSSIAVQQKTDGIEQTVLYVRKAFHHASKSKYNALLYGLALLLVYRVLIGLLSPPVMGPVPDLVKVAGLAQSFDPVICYSEQSDTQIGELQDTGVAVWDLGESVRNTNMTSAPIIVKQLEDLSESFRDLSIEMASFFAGLDGDVDGILLVMEWAQRELTALSQTPQGTIGSLWSNAHDMLSNAGIIKRDSTAIKAIVGETFQQRTRATLERTFNEFLNVMEESINNELQHSIRLFKLFEAIERQFDNVHRTVAREQSTQEQIESDFLSSMWTKVVGVNASRLRKFEKNKDLLQSVRDRTVDNKRVLVLHNGRLLTMKSNLENLRKRIASPMVKNSVNASTLSVEQQIAGLDDTYQKLKTTRQDQKKNKMAVMFGAGSRRDGHQVNARKQLPGVDV